jgi:hypothetical protein
VMLSVKMQYSLQNSSHYVVWDPTEWLCGKRGVEVRLDLSPSPPSRTVGTFRLCLTNSLGSGAEWGCCVRSSFSQECSFRRHFRPTEP